MHEEFPLSVAVSCLHCLLVGAIVQGEHLHTLQTFFFFSFLQDRFSVYLKTSHKFLSHWVSPLTPGGGCRGIHWLTMCLVLGGGHPKLQEEVQRMAGVRSDVYEIVCFVCACERKRSRCGGGGAGVMSGR